MTKEELYRSKFISVDEALDKIKSGDTIATGSYCHEPRELLRSLHTIADRVENVTVWSQIPNEDYPFFGMNELAGKIDMISLFYGGGLREAHKEQRVSLVPANLSAAARVQVETKKPTVFMAAVTPMDEHGFVRMSCSQQSEQECMEAADLVIFEANPNIPVLNGTQQIPIEKVDFFVDVDYPAKTIGAIPITDVERAIAKNVAPLVNDGDCIQLGIGGMPNAVGEALMTKNDLGIHTEMITSVMGKLMDAGVVNNSRKNFNVGKTIGAFALGDDDLYAYLNNNPMVQIMPARYVNDPFVIARNDNLVSINTALQIDLTGQICSESIGYRQFSGTGGASDFAYGAYRSKGGKGIIAISSTAKKGTVSKIQPILAPGSVVSISRNIVDYVVTEYGVAKLKNKSIRERVENLISVAHPDFRDELREQAKEMMIW